MDWAIINKIQIKLQEHKDSRVKELPQGDINVLVMSNLLAPHINASEFDIRFIASGASGAGVLLIVTDEKVPIIIKYGKKEIVDREKENYTLKVKEFIQSEIIPTLKDSYMTLGEYASIAYIWGGGWNEAGKFRDYFKHEESSKKINEQISSLMDGLFKWYRLKRGTMIPIDQWQWNPSNALVSVENKIKAWDSNDGAKKNLIAAIRNQEKWRNAIRIANFSQGFCHGDLNCNNIIISQNSIPFPKIIDFASVREGITPAKDWAKFEREIKFRFLRDITLDSTAFRKMVKRVDEVCNSLNTTDVDNSIKKPCYLITFIRKKYSEKVSSFSDAPYLEYLFYLFYITLSYIIHPEIKDDLEIQNTVIDSAYRTLEEIEKLFPYKYKNYTYPGILITEEEPSPKTYKKDIIDLPIKLEIPDSYQKWVVDRCEEINIEKLVESKDSEILLSVKMPQIFVPLYTNSLENKTNEEKEIERHEIEKKQELVNIEKLSAENEYLVIKGQAGSGKTTLLKHLAYTIAKKINPDGLNDYLPVLIFLNDLKKVSNLSDNNIAGTPKAEELLTGYFEKNCPSLTLDIIKRFCREGKAIFIFDGLDEINTEIRKIVVTSFSDFRTNNNYPKIVLAGRPHGIDTNDNNVLCKFPNKCIEINTLNNEQIKDFVKKWFLYDSKLQKEGKTPEGMMCEITAHERVKELVINPLMLTAVCILYHYDRKLPEQRVELYERFISNLIFKRFDNPLKIVEFLMRLAFKVHTEKTKEGRERERKFDNALAIKVMEEVYQKEKDETDVAYRQRLERQFKNIEQNCGLLEVSNDKQYRFWHLSFQEFLSARDIQSRNMNYDRAIEEYWDDDWYDEVIKLLIGYLAFSSNKKWANTIVESELKNKENNVFPFRRMLLAADALNDIHKDMRDNKVLKLAQDCLKDIWGKGNDPKIWVNAGETLGWLGDTRNLKEFIPIEGGEYNFKDLGVKNIKPFEISKYPVTNQWFEKFIKANGYENMNYWSEEGKKWLNQLKAKYPLYWHERKWKCPNAPVVGVCWYEANAFCRWLKQGYRLPTEQEWQATAAGLKNRIYPWGNELQDNSCNTYETKIGRISPVGIFAKGCTPLGVADMAGNVWEWTDSWFDESKNSKVLRGGSWNLNQELARCANRYRSNPVNRDNNLGFRCARTL
ncbi:SUMF1/EgtB/PvdO family nonheme iron enzyme [Candidatus Desantisbacteria bacterium]|nr:SUMF1/EgtB/PvdO family nonheme iron enzyme [Candidatus Desantisbacteria bacterium]